MDSNPDPGRQRSLSDLPMEILSLIAIRLPLIALLSFRGTCKDIRTASATATAKITSSQKPWLLLHKTNDSKCVIYNEDESKTYNRHISELDDAVCLASYQGWLLLFKDNSMYFFSPFSQSKITLPKFPHDQINGHVAAFTDVPTSPDCIITVINLTETENTHSLEINMISKGRKTWTRRNISVNRPSNPIITGATFDHESETFYYMYDKTGVLSFSVKDQKAKIYTVKPSKECTKDTKVLPFSYSNISFCSVVKKMTNVEMEVDDDESIDVCGLTMEHDEDDDNRCRRVVYLNEAVNVSATKTSKSKAVWIQPRFYEKNEDLHW